MDITFKAEIVNRRNSRPKLLWYSDAALNDLFFSKTSSIKNSVNMQ